MAEQLSYFDYAASTPVDPAVTAQMQLALADLYANISSNHSAAQPVRQAEQLAREQVASLVGAVAESILWTSGATESNNLAIFGVSDFYRRRGNHLICSATEHSSVLTPMRQLEKHGYELTVLTPDSEGLVQPEQLQEALREETILVSIHHANNETGVLQDIPALAERLRGTSTLLHVDAAQSAGKTAVSVDELGCDLLSLSAHKMYGPKGIGALYIRRKPRVQLTPLFYGGGQQQALRPGTLPTHQIIGFGCAAEIANQNMVTEQEQFWQFHRTLLAGINSFRLNGHSHQRLPGIINLSHTDSQYDPVKDLTSFAMANGAACNSSQPGPSHVLRAMGRDASTSAHALRISFGRFTTKEEIHHLGTALSQL